MDLYNNTIACYIHIDDYSVWKDNIERVLTDYSYSIQSNADRIDSCDAVVNDVQSSYSDHQVHVEALVSDMRKDLDDLSSKHLQEQVQQKQQMEHESLRRLNEMVSEIQLIKPR
jgi:type I site-specific restriction endonuclease